MQKGNSKSVMRQMDYIAEVERTIETGANISPRVGTNAVGGRQKSKNRDQGWKSPPGGNSLEIGSKKVANSPVSKSGEPRSQLKGGNWSNHKNNERVSLSPRNFKNNLYTSTASKSFNQSFQNRVNLILESYILTSI